MPATTITEAFSASLSLEFRIAAGGPALTLSGELLAFMRGRLRPLPFDELGELLTWARRQQSHIDARDDVAALAALAEWIRAIIDDCDLDDAHRSALRIMIGDDERTSWPRAMTRDGIKQLMAREFVPAGAIGVSARRVEQIERTRLVNAVLDRLSQGEAQSHAGSVMWNNVSVEIRIGPGRASDLVDYRYSLRYSTSEPWVLVASTPDDDIADWLCTTTPRLSDVIVPMRGAPFPSVFLSEARADGSRAAVNFRRIDQLDAVLGAAPDVVFWEATSELPTPHNFELTCDTVLSIDEGVAYWRAPRTLRLVDIRIDYSLFPDRGKWQFQLYPGFGKTTQTLHQRDLGQVTIRVASQIVAGNGFHISWRRDE
jgi:hypothetical protein